MPAASFLWSRCGDCSGQVRLGIRSCLPTCPLSKETPHSPIYTPLYHWYFSPRLHIDNSRSSPPSPSLLFLFLDLARNSFIQILCSSSYSSAISNKRKHQTTDIFIQKKKIQTWLPRPTLSYYLLHPSRPTLHRQRIFNLHTCPIPTGTAEWASVIL